MFSLLSEIFLDQGQESTSISSKRIVLRADNDSTVASFSMAFGLASQLSLRNESTLIICRRKKFEELSTGTLPMKVVLGPDMVTHVLGSQCSFSAMNMNEIEQKVWSAEFTRKQVPSWTQNELSNVSIKFVETLDDLISLLSSVHEWKKLLPSLIIIDSLHSYVKNGAETGGSESEEDVGLRLVTHLEDVLGYLQEAAREQIPRASLPQSQQELRQQHQQEQQQESSEAGAGRDDELRRVLALASESGKEGLGVFTAQQSMQLLEAQRTVAPPGVSLLLCESNTSQALLSRLASQLRVSTEVCLDTTAAGQMTVSVRSEQTRQQLRRCDIQGQSLQDVVHPLRTRTCVLLPRSEGDVPFLQMAPA